MADREFFPLPDEFNRGYVPPAREEEEKKKKKTRKRTLFLIEAAFVMSYLLFPMLLSGGDVSLLPHFVPEKGADLFVEDIEENDILKPGLYRNGNTVLYLEEGQGWFGDGTYFIPLRYDASDLSYAAKGAYPKDVSSALKESVFYYAESSGKIGIEEEGVVLMDPFDQNEKKFLPYEGDLFCDLSAMYDEEGSFLEGTWKGIFRPESSYPVAYPKEIVIHADHSLILKIGDTFSDREETYEMSWEYEDGVLRIDHEEISYELRNDRRKTTFVSEGPSFACVYVTADHIGLTLNIFSGQVFRKD